MSGRRGAGAGAGAVQRALADPERAPLGSALQPELAEADVPELWHRIETGLTLAWRAPGLAFAAALLAVLVWWVHRPPPAGALALEGGAAPIALGAGSQAKRFGFADGSRVDVAAGAELRVVQNDARTFVTALAHGRTTFDVHPGGPRRWVIDAGPASVEVVGTHFTVQRDGESVAVAVEHGIVLVRSRELAGGSVRLTAGQTVRVARPAGPSASTIPPAVPASAAAPVAPVPAAALALSTLAAPSEVSSTGSAQALDAVGRALAAADIARKRGDRAEAVRAFEAALAAAGRGDRRRGLAALSLARLVLTQNPDQAARVLRDAFAAMPAGLLEDALARRVEAEARAGHREEAARLAAEYERQFPAGQRTDEVRRWTAP
jgi:transmembrane sensor